MKTTVAIVGLGSRGRVTYAPIAKQYPDLMEITAHILQKRQQSMM